MEKENRKVKNNIFVDLFYEDQSAEENIISLYNALHEEPLAEGTVIEKISVGDAIFMNLKNDISFGIDGKAVVLGEHQSTVNENMPLRNLLYIGRVYEQTVPVTDRYRKKMVKIAEPEFYTFYNGTQKEVKERILKLSDAYKKNSSGNGLELNVRMININWDVQHEILTKCPILKEYSQFIEIIRTHQKKAEEHPYREAIRECIQKGILADYLKRRGSEVENMLFAEYDYEMDIAVQREEAREEERKNTEKERRRAEKAEKEIARLREQLAANGIEVQA